jgi:hypothetical protein
VGIERKVMSMAYLLALGPCILCRAVFCFNADSVPTLDVAGVREPVCRTCMERMNLRRAEAGLSPHPVLPGAYEPEES